MSTHNMFPWRNKKGNEVLLMNTHNICFHGEIRKKKCGYPLLSVAMTVALVKSLKKNGGCGRASVPQNCISFLN